MKNINACHVHSMCILFLLSLSMGDCNFLDVYYTKIILWRMHISLDTV